MREIKFMLWDGKIMSGPFTLADMTRYGYTDLKGITILQFTGLKDKNGREIYEGDIVKSPDYDNAMQVSYDEIQASDDMTAPGIGFQFNTEPSKMEIVGNIYENPDLLTN